ncbi:MAG: DUF1877 family protein [Sphingomonas sp.]
MTYNLIRTSPAAVEQLRGRPAAVTAFIYKEAYVAPKPGFFDRLLGTGSAAGGPTIPARGDNDEIDLDKSWHIIHYLLTGEISRAPEPLGLIGDDLHPLADIELGSGKPNVISADIVKAFTDAVADMSDEDFLSRFKPDDMPNDELYLGDLIERGDGDDIKGYTLDNFHRLRDFVAAAAKDGQSLITYFS